MNGGKSPRKEVVTSLDNIDQYAGIISGDWKLVNGTTMQGIFDGFLGDVEKVLISSEVYTNVVLSSKVSKILCEPQKRDNQKVLSAKKISKLRDLATISCNEKKNPINVCNPLQFPCLFNIIDDPCERNNLAKKFPEVLKKLVEQMNTLVKNSVPSRRIPFTDPNCDPNLHNGTWSSWVSEI